MSTVADLSEGEKNENPSHPFDRPDDFNMRPAAVDEFG
jgi:hypothetical protein